MTRVYELARAEIGTVEWAEGSNPKVVAYYRDAGQPGVQDDAVAWCAAFVGAMLRRAGLPNTGSLAARSYLDWGEAVPLDEARAGDIVVFWRGSPNGWQGHVGFFVRHRAPLIEVLGGNQRDQVSIASYPASRLLGVRRMDQPKETEMADLKPIEGAQTSGKAQAAGLAGFAGGILGTLIGGWLDLDAEATSAITIALGAIFAAAGAFVKKNWLKG